MRTRTPSHIIKEREQAFQDAMEHWIVYQDLASWHIMWSRIYDCCFNICKRRLANKGLSPERIQETALDGACYCMDVIKRLGKRPRKLSAFCWSYVTFYILKPQTKFEDMNVRRMADYTMETEEVLWNRDYTKSDRGVLLQEDDIYRGDMVDEAIYSN